MDPWSFLRPTLFFRLETACCCLARKRRGNRKEAALPPLQRISGTERDCLPGANDATILRLCWFQGLLIPALKNLGKSWCACLDCDIRSYVRMEYPGPVVRAGVGGFSSLARRASFAPWSCLTIRLWSLCPPRKVGAGGIPCAVDTHLKACSFQDLGRTPVS